LRTARVQISARFFGEICHISGVGATLRNAFFGQYQPDDYHEIDWLYGHRA
jgi:hypothetical protein